MEILPSINCHYKDFDCVREKVSRVNHLAKFVHVDVADGKFTHNKSWNESGKWKELATEAELEVHLMVEQPERYVEEWLKAGAKRIIVHYEAVCEPHYRALPVNPEEVFQRMFAECEDAGCELMLAINAETKLSKVGDYLELFDSYLLMAQSYPGPGGQPFLPLTLVKIADLREKFPEARIEIDGGMDPDTMRLSREAGADVFVVGSYLFAAENILERYHELLDSIS